MKVSCNTPKGIIPKKKNAQINKLIKKYKLVKTNACLTFEPKYLLDYKVLKIINNSTLLLITPNKTRK